MPFHKKCRITLENLDDNPMMLYYQINYTLTEVPEDAAYFHAQFRRENPLKTKGLYTILDGVEGKGQYVGTYLAWGVHETGWWGEGEIKFYHGRRRGNSRRSAAPVRRIIFAARMISRHEGPTTNLITRSSPRLTAGLAQVIRPDGLYESQTRFGLYRWHICAIPSGFRRT